MKKIMVVVVVLLMVACSGNRSMTNGQIIGTVGGGLVGGLVGSHFGGGAANILFIVAGTAAGAAAGYSFGNTLIPSDRTQFEKSTTIAMEKMNDGQQMNWSNPDTGVAGTITPVKSYQTRDGFYCRDFDASIAVKKEGVGHGKGRACKAEGGSWQIDARV